MSNEQIYTLVPSTNRGGSALDDPQGYDLTSSQPVSILLGDCWTLGHIEHQRALYTSARTGQAEPGYYFQALNGTMCGLCTGMRVHLR